MKFVSLESEIEHSKKLMYTAGIELDIVKKGDPLLLSSVEETMISLCVREAMTNIIKHSKAKRCTIQFEIIDHIYFIQIMDDGIGLVKVERGNGIQSMKERMQALQGTAAVNNSPVVEHMSQLSSPSVSKERRIPLYDTSSHCRRPTNAPWCINIFIGI